MTSSAIIDLALYQFCHMFYSHKTQLYMYASTRKHSSSNDFTQLLLITKRNFYNAIFFSPYICKKLFNASLFTIANYFKKCFPIQRVQCWCKPRIHAFLRPNDLSTREKLYTRICKYPAVRERVYIYTTAASSEIRIVDRWILFPTPSLWTQRERGRPILRGCCVLAAPKCVYISFESCYIREPVIFFGRTFFLMREHRRTSSRPFLL